MQVKIRILGAIRETWGLKETVLDIPMDSTVGSTIQVLIGDNESLRSLLWDLEVDSPSPNALIMLNGVEINNLQGMETPIKQGQELVLLSVVHGG
ncbi:MoaD/ThiS family protein [Candidatus Bathyarchaeota archaeon]|nr:MoaD/ThiS family protein [Candidatus Bathyarchaeota archaeon]